MIGMDANFLRVFFMKQPFIIMLLTLDNDVDYYDLLRHKRNCGGMEH